MRNVDNSFTACCSLLEVVGVRAPVRNIFSICLSRNKCPSVLQILAFNSIRNNLSKCENHFFSTSLVAISVSRQLQCFVTFNVAFELRLSCRHSKRLLIWKCLSYMYALLLFHCAESVIDSCS